MKSRFSKYIKAKKNELMLNVGIVKLIKQIGEGGNGIVYNASIFKKDYAIKFLLTSESGKTKKYKEKRFLAEYFNIVTLEDTNGIVRYVDYDVLKLKDDKGEVEIPVIIMKKYDHSLKKSSSKNENLEEEFIKFFDFLLNTVEKIHNNGIIHRDLKPENILVYNNNYVLADFGIAAYNPKMFKLKATTKQTERIGNRLFSAPEQESSETKAHNTMDIYAVGQLLQWFVFGETHRGTNRKRLSIKLDSLQKYDRIIDTCLSNEPKDRFQSIQDIRDYLNKITNVSELSYEAYLSTFAKILVNNFPKNEKGIIHSNNLDRINKLFQALKEKETFFNNKLVWHNGSSSNHFKLEYKAKGKWKFNDRELEIEEIWLHYDDSSFNDFIIIHYKKGEPFTINAKKDYSNIIVDDKYEITRSEYDNRKAEIEGKIIDLSKHKVELIDRYEKEGYWIISTRFHCAWHRDNRDLLRNIFQNKSNTKEKFNTKELQDLEKKMRINKHIDVLKHY